MSLSAWIGRWSPGIGDPTVMGWITVAAYFACAWLCWRARRVAVAERRNGATHRSDVVWTAFTIGMVALGINKQLDLQSALTELGRSLAHAQGWYENRRPVQRVFVLGVLIGAVGLGAWLMVGARRDLRRLWLPLLGGVALCTFVVVRATSFERMDDLIDVRWAGVRMNWILELGGIALVAVGAWRYGAGERRGRGSGDTRAAV